MNFGEAIKSGFNNYVNFNGRASRSEYNYWTLFVILISFLAEIIDPSDYYSNTGGTLGLIWTVIIFLPALSMVIRRLHDSNKSGWYYLWALTIIGLFPVIYWLCFKAGDNSTNQYGENPLSGSGLIESTYSGSSNESQTINIEEELKKLKKMLDDGLIEQSDYDAKKKELLNL